MDPLSAFGLAANIVAFLDFAGGLISKGQKIYKSVSGALEENAEVENVMRELSRQANLLQGGGLDPPVPEERLLMTLAESCSDLGGEILITLAGLTVRQDVNYRGLRSIGKALKGAWGEKELKAKVARIDDLRGQMQFSILVGLKYVVYLHWSPHNQTSQRLASQTPVMANALQETTRLGVHTAIRTI
jgi:hypothetical protein